MQYLSVYDVRGWPSLICSCRGTVQSPPVLESGLECLAETCNCLRNSKKCLSVSSVETIIHKHLKFRKLSARRVPKLLNSEQKQQRCLSRSSGTLPTIKSKTSFWVALGLLLVIVGKCKVVSYGRRPEICINYNISGEIIEKNWKYYRFKSNLW